MKKIILASFMVVILTCLFIISVSAGSFGDADTSKNIPVGTNITDINSQIMMKDNKVYPSYYFFDDSTTGKLKFDRGVNKEDGNPYTKGDIVKMEIPEGVTKLEDYNFLDNGKNTSLTYVKFPSTLREITRQSFNGCKLITSVTIPDSVVTIGPTAFAGCKALTEVIINPTSQLEKICSQGFKETAITSFYFPNSLKTLENHVFAYNINGSLKELINFENCGVTSIPRGLFRQCGGLKTIKFPKGLTSFDGAEMFVYCNIDTIYLPKTLTTITNNVDASSIKTVIYAAPEGQKLTATFTANTEIVYANYCNVYNNNNHTVSAPQYVFTSYVDDCYMASICTGCGLAKTTETFDPMFKFLGYSTNGKNMCSSYIICIPSINEYNEANIDNPLKYGFVASANIEAPIGADGIFNDNTINIDLSNESYVSFDFILTGDFTNSLSASAEISMNLYTITQGENSKIISYIYGETVTENNVTIFVNKVYSKPDSISFNDLIFEK